MRSSACERILRLAFLEVDARQAKGGFVAHALLDVALEHSANGAPGAQVHPVVELEVAHGKLRLPMWYWSESSCGSSTRRC